MGVAEASGSTEVPSVLNIFLQVFTTKYIFLMFGITFLILIVYIYILFKSSKWILKGYKAQKIQQSEKSLLYSVLEELSRKAEVKTPELFRFKSEVPAMFTVGCGTKYYITISTSMLEMFDEIELESLLAHEIGHIKNRDVALNTLIAFLAGLVMSFPNFVMLCSIYLGFGQLEDPIPRIFRFIATGLATPPAAALVHFTNPMKREFAADEVAIKLTKKPQSLIKILEFLENYIPLQPVTSRSNLGHFHLFSTHLQQVRGDCAIFTYMFDTHPEIGDRITRLLSHSTCNNNDTLNNIYTRVPGFFDLRYWRCAIEASLVSYIMLLSLIIVVITFLIKDFDPIIIGSICGIYILLVILFIGTVSIISCKKQDYKLKSSLLNDYVKIKILFRNK